MTALRIAHYGLILAISALVWVQTASVWLLAGMVLLLLGLVVTSSLLAAMKFKAHLDEVRQAAQVLVDDSQARQKRLEAVVAENTQLKGGMR